VYRVKKIQFSYRAMHTFTLAFLVTYDLMAVIGAVGMAIVCRFDWLRFSYVTAHVTSAPLVLATYLLAFNFFRLYRYRWSFAGVEMVWSIFLANVVATMMAIIWQLLIDGARMPWSISMMTCVFTTVLIGGQRLLLRSVARSMARGGRVHDPKDRWREEPTRVLIMGNERSAMEVLTALSIERPTRCEIIGILDPDAHHHGAYLRGIKILGPWEKMHDLVRQHAVDEVIIAAHHGGGEQLREYVVACCRHKLAVRIVPVTAEWLENPAASRRQMHGEQIRVEDLLHRQPIQAAPADLTGEVRGKHILVTGAGGSIGAELCRQVCRHHPRELILLGHGENSIHEIMLELRQQYAAMSERIIPMICDVRDADRLDYIYDLYRPQIVLHAAAHKHVPLMEGNVAEAVNNNVAGTRNVLRATIAHHAERMVMISTDKAVNPSSVMGVTKFLCEEMMRAAAGTSDTTLITVRFGNVLGSRGSVLPHFQQQILSGGPVTVTHQEMRRYFMTIPEAVSLVLRAGLFGHAGELFVLDMGNPVRIVNLAEDLIRLSGLVPYRDIAIEFCGLRPGEKLAEELLTEREQREATMGELVYVVQRPQYIPREQLQGVIDHLLVLAASNDDQQVLLALKQAVPTFRAGEMMLPASATVQAA
jgi:FlaA1/EpsC-like NDP-sugar epimerase